MTRILFVCLGNICRSPTAEAVFRKIAPEVQCDSAGTGDWHIGDPPYGPAVQAGQKRGYDLTPLRARQVNQTDFDRFDLILAMDRKNFSDLKAVAPRNARARLALFTDFAPATQGQDVPDPYYTRDFDGALDLIELAAKGLKRHVSDADQP